MGLGIENRARNLAPFWAEHLNRTRAAQARWAETAGGERLTVLGAGRLLDFNRTALLPRFANLRLVDADPLCQTVWKDLHKPLKAVCTDITGCLDSWLSALHRVRKPWPTTLNVIRDQSTPPGTAYCAPGDALLSLNILSQLQIVWQDGVEAYLQHRFGRRFVAQREAEWLDALRPAGKLLVEQHLAAFERSAARHVLLITDLEYLEYQGKVFQRAHALPPPVEWSPKTGWRADPGITCELSPALESVELHQATFADWLPSYRLVWQEYWLWHILPLGTERHAHSGKVHRVGAFAFELLP